MIATYVVDELKTSFPKSQKAAKPTWMQSDTVKAIEEKADIFKLVVEGKRRGDDTREQETALKKKVTAVKKLVRRDRQRCIDEITSKSMHAFDERDTRAAFRQLKKLKPYKPRPCDAPIASDGRRARDQGEAEQIWSEHWANLLDGKKSTFQQIFENNRQRLKNDEDEDVEAAMDYTDVLPTVDDLAGRINMAKPFRSHGSDPIPVDILKAAPTEASEKIHPLAVKCMVTRRWPAQWQGDIHIPIPKGNGKYRGVSLEDAMAKTVNAHVRKHVIAKAAENAPEDTYGGLPALGTDMAIHMRAQIEEYMRTCGSTYARIFYDMVAAFDRTSRQYMDEKPPDGDPVHEITKAIHRSTWVITPYSDEPILTTSGVKQGDPVADAAFVMIASSAIKEIRARLGEGAFITFTLRSRSLLDGGGEPLEEVDVAELTYVDDLMITVLATHPRDITEEIRWTTKVVKEEMKKAGLVLNFSKGKSEVVIHYRAKNSVEAKRELHEMNCKIEIDDEDALTATEMYKHLGSRHSSRTAATHHARAVVNKINEKEAEYRSILKSSKFSNEVKKKIINITMASSLYAIHTVPYLSQAQESMIAKRYHTLLRTAFGEIHHDPAGMVLITNSQVRALYNMPAVTTVIKLRRLGYLVRVLTRAPRSLRAIIQHNAAKTDDEKSWAKTILRDLQWLHSHVSQLQELPDPEDDVSAWEDIIIANPAWWKEILQKVVDMDKEGVLPEEHGDDQREVRYDGETWHCTRCDIVFSLKRAYCLHCVHRHDREHPAQRYARENGQCMWCGTTYGKRLGVLRHLTTGFNRRNAGSCLGQLLINEVPQLDDETVADLKMKDTALRKSNRRAGLPTECTGAVHQTAMGPRRLSVYGPVQIATV
eukprot:TRINITY_DN40255_c0_g1_i2.p1 TRINITY_DN40255_c0_g1~~TRINITY_DN40255_c0_g1_i2.p1  ORF type:complete len:877 (-),score=139.14 TRINITY_DN40255_c0_g1_i2:416-3046(-)